MPGSAPCRVAFDDFHVGPADRQAAGGHILCDYGISGRGGVAANPYRGDEDRVARDIGAVADLGGIFLETIPTRGDAPRANIHVRPNDGVAEVREMRYCAAGADPRVLDLGVGPDVNAFPELGPRPQPAERPDRDVGGKLDSLKVRALDPAAVTDGRVAYLGHRPDHAVLADDGLAGDRAERMDDAVLADAHIGIDERRARVGDRYAAGHQISQDALAHDVLGLRQLPPVVDAQDLFRIGNQHRLDLAFDQRDDISQVILLGLVLVLQLLQRRP